MKSKPSGRHVVARSGPVRSGAVAYRHDSGHEATAGWTASDDLILIQTRREMKGYDLDKRLAKRTGSTVKRKEYFLEVLARTKDTPAYLTLPDTHKAMIYYYRFKLHYSYVKIGETLKLDTDIIVTAIAELLLPL